MTQSTTSINSNENNNSNQLLNNNNTPSSKDYNNREYTIVYKNSTTHEHCGQPRQHNPKYWAASDVHQAHRSLQFDKESYLQRCHHKVREIQKQLLDTQANIALLKTKMKDLTFEVPHTIPKQKEGETVTAHIVYARVSKEDKQSGATKEAWIYHAKKHSASEWYLDSNGIEKAIIDPAALQAFKDSVWKPCKIHLKSLETQLEEVKYKKTQIVEIETQKIENDSKITIREETLKMLENDKRKLTLEPDFKWYDIIDEMDLKLPIN